MDNAIFSITINIRKFKIVSGGLGVKTQGLVGGIIEGQRAAKRVKAKALEVLDKSDWNEVLELAGSTDISGEASAALKAVLAERITEYTVRAMRESRKRGTRLGAAAIIIAASKTR